MWSDPYDDEFAGYVGGGFITPQQAHIKEYSKDDTREHVEGWKLRCVTPQEYEHLQKQC